MGTSQMGMMVDYHEIYKKMSIDDTEYFYYDIPSLNDPRYDELPVSIRYLLEAAIRKCDGVSVCCRDVEAIFDWKVSQKRAVDMSFVPSRVLLQDLTGVPAIVDLASMRDAVEALNSDPSLINPVCSVDLVIDHSIQVDHYKTIKALEKNQLVELERNHERFKFLKWGSSAFENLNIIPPGIGIVHQVNLEYLARTVDIDKFGCLHPDSVIGTDSHTTMNNGSGVLAWGVGGIEAEAVMLGQPISMVVPEVIGCHLKGALSAGATSTDLVLTITQKLRSYGVVGKFVEFYGPGVKNLTIADRATIANMCPEYGATVGFFPVDSSTIKYLQLTGRDEHAIKRALIYLKRNKMFLDEEKDLIKPSYTDVVEIDLGAVVPCVSGPKRPQDIVALTVLHKDFRKGISENVSFKGFGIRSNLADKKVEVDLEGQKCELKHGSVVISAITSCTNTANPSVMLAAGLLAKKAVEAGLSVPPYVKISLSPGSGVVSKYLEKSGLLPYLHQLGYHIVGYGCMTCIGNSGPLHQQIVEAIEQNDLVAVSVLSGNRNFEGRVHANVRANYLCSPPLVVAFGLAGRVDFDIENEPIGKGHGGKEIYLREIWPTREEIKKLEESVILPVLFTEVYAKAKEGSNEWQHLDCPEEQRYSWDPLSTYIRKVPFFDGMGLSTPKQIPILNAFALLVLGDFVTTDHISPAGSISKMSPAARYLMSQGVSPNAFNTYGARRGNAEVMVRGTFANIRLVNKLASRAGPKTMHVPSGDEMYVYEAAKRYEQDGHQVIILAGKDYGCGSSRDWAAKGPKLLNVRAVLAESFERIHRSNLIGMGILPLQYVQEQNATSLGLTGLEQFSVNFTTDLKPGAKATVQVSTGKQFDVLCRLDTPLEVTYYQNNGLLPYMIRKLLKETRTYCSQ